jgi:hypothetical protein
MSQSQCGHTPFLLLPLVVDGSLSQTRLFASPITVFSIRPSAHKNRTRHDTNNTIKEHKATATRHPTTIVGEPTTVPKIHVHIRQHVLD